MPIACNRATADFLLSSLLMDGRYDRLVHAFDGAPKSARNADLDAVIVQTRSIEAKPRE